jgi:UDP-N-acetylglucosamine 2-epimerase
MKTLLTVVGARPQFIKASALRRVLAEGRHGLREVLLHTGQHGDDAMSGVFFRELGMAPPERLVTLPVSEVGGGVPARFGTMVEGIWRAVEEERPDALLVYGDTDSTCAGAWVAARAGLPLVHVEAGLRSYDRAMPEEVNRVVADVLADVCLCTNAEAAERLRGELGPVRGAAVGIHVVGDVMLDVARFVAGEAQVPRSARAVLTLHRPSNVDDPARLGAWLEAVGELARPGEPSGEVVFPVHPRTAAGCARRFGSAWIEALAARGIQALPPVSYLEMARLVQGADFVVTDSGGVQKEAFYFNRPCVVARPVTEWTELVAGGYAVLAPDPADLAAAAASALAAASTLDFDAPLYGDGRAAERTADLLHAWLGA